MSHTTIPKDSEYYWDLYNRLDTLDDGCIDVTANLESGNWGCPVENTEEIRTLMMKVDKQVTPLLESLKELAEYFEGGVDGWFRKVRLEAGEQSTESEAQKNS